jgi:hypothetical protein
VRGLINFGPKSVATLWGRGGFVNRSSPVFRVPGDMPETRSRKFAREKWDVLTCVRVPELG